ncbi:MULTISPECIES: GGDEF domain-containing protein [Acinetobacter]|uniref:GGDEF domain-containing protein n=1 Tax=Acinetobacter TaxID=469 RepID=UPI0004D4C818|nr:MULTISPECIES: GGDEF domain-containing protein [Acinetobacter]KEC83756.1 response regulator [Acinetobacter sp. ETR1]MCT9978968.1 diguanylate cyclase [Acinetobacter sp. I-MWF]MDO6643936.1 diguanylate cyclase [Acinetobacter guillouiae]WEE41383.1 diguanylate cyclase [Acinetobacter sp. TAC-1]
MPRAIAYLSQTLKDNISAFFIIAMIIFVCALAGIFGRPLSFLAIFWPANAVLLGLFLRFHRLKNIGGWIGAFTAFMLADLLTGNSFLITFFLTLANLAHALVTLGLIRFFKLDYKQYNKGLTFLYLFAISAFGGCLASPIVASLTVPYLPNTFMVMDRIWIDFGMWWTGEILNVIAFLPIILAIPDKKTIQSHIQQFKQQPFQYEKFLPLLGVILSVILTHFFLGPGAIMFPIAALVWAALSYNLFFVSIINCIVCMLLYNALTAYYIAQSPDAYLGTTLSVRIGLMMLALGPLTLAIISLNRQKLYHQILYLANHDGLTTTLNRRYFYEESERTIAEDVEKQQAHSVTILVLDLDHFKKINDQYGHVIGDYVLQEFTHQVKAQIRANDLFGRLGGEEFAILLKDLSLEQSVAIAQRICNSVFNTPIHLDDQRSLNISVSIGLSYQTLPYCIPFQQLIKRADDALYLAKEKGRNQLCLETTIEQNQKIFAQ